jgi:hypothetical protein
MSHDPLPDDFMGGELQRLLSKLREQSLKTVVIRVLEILLDPMKLDGVKITATDHPSIDKLKSAKKHNRWSRHRLCLL